LLGPGGRGYWVDPVVEVDPEEIDSNWPFYVLEWGRTEDHYFCEMAMRCGFEILVDTWLDCQHLGIQPVTWRHFWKVRDTYAAQVALQGMLGEEAPPPQPSPVGTGEGVGAGEEGDGDGRER